jgi:phage tail-like protein
MSDTTPHYLLDGLAGWRQAALDGTVLSHDGATLSLQPLPGSVRSLVDGTGSFGGLQSGIGIAVDREDRVYVLDGKAWVIKRFDRCLGTFVTLPCVGGAGTPPRQFQSPHGMAISCRDDIYVADTGNHRVQIFSVKGLALRWILGPFNVTQAKDGISVAPAIPTATAPSIGSHCGPVATYPPNTWQPWDVAVTSRNWTYVSDYANGLIHLFDPQGCWVRALTGASATHPQLVKPTRIALDKEGRLYVIQEGQNYVVVLDVDGNFSVQVGQPAEIVGKFCPVAVAVDASGNLCLSDCVTRKIYFYQPDGDGGWCPAHCSGCVNAFASSLIFDLAGNPIYTDGSPRVCQLDPQAAYPVQGTFIAGPLDSKTYRCLWHRVVLRGVLPPGTAIRVDTFTAEASKTTAEIIDLPESRWSTGLSDTAADCCYWDCLTLSPPGRYLWLRLTMSGEGTATPSIDHIKVYYPRNSSLRYLPAVYREDSVSADFLARFLSIFDTLRGRTSAQITDIARYFDPKATPANPKNVGGPDFLAWLASWLGMSLQTNWPVEKRRELVRRAYRLYALRGTPAGLRLHIELYTGSQPRILELFRLRRWFFLNSARLGDCSTVFGDDVMKRLQVGVNSKIGSFQLVDYGDPSLDMFNAYAYQFLVVVPKWAGATQSDEQNLQQIIDLAKPAHTVAELRWAEPRLRIGIQSFIGVDTVIGKYPIGVVEGQGKLGYDTVLGSPAESKARPQVRVGRTSRVGCGTVLN